MAPSILNLPPCSAADERAFRARHEEDVAQLLPFVGPMLAVTVVLFSIWDYWIDPANAGTGLFFRAGFALAATFAFRSTALPWTPTQRAGFLHWMLSLAVFSATFVLDDGLGLLYGMVGVVVGTFLVSVIAVRVRTFVYVTLPPYLLFAVLAWLHVPVFQFINSLLFFALALGIALLLMILVRFLRWKAFLLERELGHLARHDALTGLNNRGRVVELAQAEFARAARHQRPLAVVMFDVDHFKRVNDEHGHAVGDEVLKALAAICQQNLREVDHLGRLGGEEFVCILPETAADEALACAERLRRAVEAAIIETRAGPIRITVSLGIAVYPYAGTDWESVLRAADAAMYDAKHQGRNRALLALKAPGSALVFPDGGAAVAGA